MYEKVWKLFIGEENFPHKWMKNFLTCEEKISVTSEENKNFFK